MKIYDYQDYKKYINDLILTFPKNGRGQYLAISKSVDCHTTLVSQIFNGDREINLEQAIKICDFYNFDQREKRYFLTLVEFSRAGNYQLKEHFKTELSIQKTEALSLENRLKVKKSLDDSEMARFYSDSNYSTIHLLSMIPELLNSDEISKSMDIKKDQLNEILDFLITCGLVVKDSDGYKIGPNQTHLSKSSPYIISHHRNWRLKAIEKQKNRNPKDLFYSGQIVMGKDDFEKVKDILGETLERIYEIIGPSPCEDLYGLNIDWFEVLK